MDNTENDVLTIINGIVTKCKEGLVNLVIPDGVTEIGGWAFNGCESLLSVVIPEGVTEIGKWAFGGCESLSSVVIGEGVTEIGEEAFNGCKSLKSIVIPSTVTEIGGYAFDGCNDVENVVSASASFPFNEKTRKLYDATKKTKKVILVLTAAKEETKKAKIQQVQNAGATAVLESILSEHHVENVQVRNTGNEQFVAIPAIDGGIEVCLGDANVSKWMQTLPVLLDKANANGSAKELREYAKANGLPDSTNKHLKISQDGSIKLKKDAKPVHIAIPDGVVDIDDLFNDCKSLVSVALGEGMTEISPRAFDGCSSLKLVVIPASVTKISSRAFFECSSLSSVILPEGVTEIGGFAFSRCESLKSMVIPKGVTKIDEGEFEFCESLSSVVIPEGVTEIVDGAFFGCKSLESVKLPKSLKTLGEWLFYGCTSLTEIVFSGTMAQWKAIEKKDGEMAWNTSCPVTVVKCSDGEVAL